MKHSGVRMRGASDGGDCVAGFWRAAASRRRLNCCERGHARRSRNCSGAIAAVNERRSGRSDRSADFRVLAQWFADCGSDDDAHRLARAAFALNPARHFSLDVQTEEDVPASTSWLDAPPLTINPRLREYGEAAPRGRCRVCANATANEN